MQVQPLYKADRIYYDVQEPLPLITALLIRHVFYSISVKIKGETTTLKTEQYLTLRVLTRSEQFDAHFWLLFKAI